MNFTAQNITCIRGGRLVLEDVSFTLERGVANVLTGPNGAGKSTLLRVVAGLVDHQSGALTWRDEGGAVLNEDERPYSSLFHYIGHQDGVKPSLSVEENLSFWADLYGARDDLGEALQTLGLGGLGDVPGAFLSAGQKKRLCLAKLLLGKRALWILDEPSVSLDVDGVALVAGLMKKHCEAGGMLLVTTHVDIGLGDAQTRSLKLSVEGRLESDGEAT